AVGRLMRQGNQQTATYTYNDLLNTFTNSITYYRIRIVDINGNSTYSKIVAISPENINSTKFLITPNPVEKEASLVFTNLEDANVQVKIYNNAGMLHHTINTTLVKGTTVLTISEVENWPAGIYMVRAIIGDKLLTQKMILPK
ncbi:MAG TPA: T9SS type A sorting domain-containing protein, partial [Chitinophagaceae bacterium]|nr:T9SS type A sorting domain-containing protein [Chitinophagaceae bacterium]